MTTSKLAVRVGGATTRGHGEGGSGLPVGKRTLTSQLPPASARPAAPVSPARSDGDAERLARSLPRLQLDGIPPAAPAVGGDQEGPPAQASAALNSGMADVSHALERRGGAAARLAAHGDATTSASGPGGAVAMAVSAEQPAVAEHDGEEVPPQGEPATAPPDGIEAEPAEEPDGKTVAGEKRGKDPEGDDPQAEATGDVAAASGATAGDAASESGDAASASGEAASASGEAAGAGRADAASTASESAPPTSEAAGSAGTPDAIDAAGGPGPASTEAAGADSAGGGAATGSASASTEAAVADSAGGAAATGAASSAREAAGQTDDVVASGAAASTNAAHADNADATDAVSASLAPAVAGEDGVGEDGAAAPASGDAQALAHVDAALQPQDAGQSLPDALREQMEDSVGVDLADVRIHTGGEPAATLDAVGGKAATKGKHVVLGAGVDPESEQGQEILEHELVHVVQQAEGRAAHVGSEAGEGQRAGLEAEAHGHSRRDRRRERGGRGGGARGERDRHAPGERGVTRRLALPETGPALFIGLPNPIDVAKDVAGAVIDGAEAAGNAIVNEGKKAIGTIKKTAGKLIDGIADGVRKVVRWISQGVRGIASAIGSLRDFAKRLHDLPIVGAILGPIVSGLAAAAEAAGKVYRAIRRRARRFIAGARKLYDEAKQLIKRGPAYCEAATRAVGQAVSAGVQDVGDLLKRGRELIKDAAHAVWLEAKRRFERIAHNVRMAYRGVKTGIAAIGEGVDRAGRWIEKHKDKLSNLAHLTLDVVGLLPGVGPIADVANGLLYAAEGNWKQAGASLFFAIPALGDAAKAGQLGAKGAEAAVKMRGAMQKTFKYAHSGLDSARARARNWDKLLDRVADAQQDRIQRFRRMLGSHFDEIERRYHDFKPRVRELKKDMQERLERYRDRYRDRRQELHAKLKEAREMVDMFLKVQSIQNGFNQAMEDWVTGPVPPPPVPGAPAPAVG